ncbi:MAG TPA: hypothetical protein VMV73_02910, partial [Candidatus Dormibacteraeota bacterium]|nr:hypothetical protein [Candidatus Dormibacteraeota bacterium]
VRIRDNTATYRANGASFTREVNSSSAQFFALPPGAGEVLGAWVAAAGRSGSAQLSPCPTIPWVKGFGVMSQPKPTHRKVRKGIAAMPDLALAIPQARATASPVDAHCTLFYQSARVLESASLHYPLGNHLRHEVDAEVLIEIGRHNNIVGAVMYVPTGMGAFDRGALDAAKRTHFRSARALCKTVPSLYLYIARFAPSPGL